MTLKCFGRIVVLSDMKNLTPCLLPLLYSNSCCCQMLFQTRDRDLK